MSTPCISICPYFSRLPKVFTGSIVTGKGGEGYEGRKKKLKILKYQIHILFVIRPQISVQI